MQLIAPVLSDEQAMPPGIDRETLAVADPRGESLCRRKCLAGLIRVVTPYAAARFKLRAGVGAQRSCFAVFGLAGVSCGCDIDIHESIGIDCKGVHGMIPAKRQSRYD